MYARRLMSNDKFSFAEYCVKSSLQSLIRLLRRDVFGAKRSAINRRRRFKSARNENRCLLPGPRRRIPVDANADGPRTECRSAIGYVRPSPKTEMTFDSFGKHGRRRWKRFIRFSMPEPVRQSLTLPFYGRTK